MVDDNRDSADSLAMMLRRMGSTIRTAYDGEEAVETVRVPARSNPLGCRPPYEWLRSMSPDPTAGE
jgi:CheY-like chemotaxis protein